MTGVRYITQMCFSSNLAGIVANKIEQSFYSAYSDSGIESIEHTLNNFVRSTLRFHLYLVIGEFLKAKTPIFFKIVFFTNFQNFYFYKAQLTSNEVS